MWVIEVFRENGGRHRYPSWVWGWGPSLWAPEHRGGMMGFGYRVEEREVGRGRTVYVGVWVESE